MVSAMIVMHPEDNIGPSTSDPHTRADVKDIPRLVASSITYSTCGRDGQDACTQRGNLGLASAMLQVYDEDMTSANLQWARTLSAALSISVSRA